MSEVRALLLTDIVDSTQLAATIGDDAMAQAWAAHDRVARDLLLAHHGREIDKTDGMLLMFGDAASALAFARDYHRSLAALPMQLRARAGLHVGPVILRENAAEDVARGAKPLEVDGLAKPTAARIMALGHGGQTLFTAEARDALHGTGLAIRSHGHWMVKGVAEPVEVFEALEPGEAVSVPEDSDKAYRVVRAGEWWLPVRDIPHNLPHQSTSFVGREAEIAEAEALLEHTRLLTLLGMGGLGKTRLALRVAADQLHLYPDGVWFLDLAPLRDGALVLAEAAQVIGVKPEPDRDLLQSLCAHLKARRALIVLDNCEHVLKASADLANAVLKAAPFVRIIASSREALHLPGEQAYPLRPLPLPARDADAAGLAQSPAARLFIERAQQQKPSFAADGAHGSAVAELVIRLEGIPLALELAAARVRALPVTEINARLKDRYRILTGGGAVLQERQQTLRALVDWSYDLLSETEQTLLRRLGVFVGGFDLAAAEQVCSTAPLGAEDVLDLLSSLVEKSLVLLDENEDGGRYRMLETMRDYAREKLQQADELPVMLARHSEHYFALSKAVRNGMLGPEQAEWIHRAEVDIDNIRSAIAQSLAGNVDPVIGAKIAVALHGFWLLRGYATEGRRLLRAALSVPAIQASDTAHAWVLYVCAGLAEGQSDHAEALRMLEECLLIRRRLGVPVDVGATLSTLSLARLWEGDHEGAERDESEALGIFRDLGHRLGQAICLLHLGQIAAYRNDEPTARSRLEQSLAIAREVRSQEVEGACNLLMGEVLLVDDVEQAAQWFKRSFNVCRESGDKSGEANALHWMGRSDLRKLDLASGRSRLTEALTSFHSFGMWEELLGCLEGFVELIGLEGSAVDALQLSAAIDKARENLRLVRSPSAEQLWQQQLAACRGALGSRFADEVWNEGRAWSIDDAMRNAAERPAETAGAV